jgi:multidrug efflux pump subunit AcrB
MIDPTSKDALSDIEITTQTGIVPLSSIASIEETEQSSTILHKEGKTYIRVTAKIDPAKLSVINKEIQMKIHGDPTDKKNKDGIKTPAGVEVLIGGASAQQASDFEELFVTMIAAIVIVYFIMVVTFKTLRGPLAIMFSLPLAAFGAVLGLYLTGTAIDITSMFGILMLIGIIVTNAIVLIDRVKQNEQTMIIRDAIVEAASTRMRPILMTAIATICAMLPLLFAESQMGSIVSKGLAVVVIGGLVAGTVLTLVMVPVIYETLHFRKAKKQRLTKVSSASSIEQSL